GILFIFAMLFLSMIAACGSDAESTNSAESAETSNSAESTASDSSTDSNDSTASDSEPVEIEFWYSFGGTIEENNLNLVDMFNNSQDEVF
ncbi:hypothetical protein, partial [Pseudomonas sp. 2822-17]|uniref:hypothetical protein n=1 Tax=Pseudomonas sp. 2822-17 TaxID=1712678 RepID=UPI001C478DA2